MLLYCRWICPGSFPVLYKPYKEERPRKPNIIQLYDGYSLSTIKASISSGRKPCVQMTLTWWRGFMREDKMNHGVDTYWKVGWGMGVQYNAWQLTIAAPYPLRISLLGVEC